MYKLILAAVVCITSSAAIAQEESKAALKKWRACADATATRFAKSTEAAQVVSRLAILSCGTEKQAAWQALSQESGPHMADDYVEIEVATQICLQSTSSKCGYESELNARMEACPLLMWWTAPAPDIVVS